MTTLAPALTAAERDTLVVLGYLHLEQSRPLEAATLLRPLHRLLPADAEVARCLALAELSAGNFTCAARLAAQAYPQAPETVRSAMGLIYARALWASGDQAGAREALLKVLARKEAA